MATQPCRCGYLADSECTCTRAPRCPFECQSKISGPLFARIDLNVDVPEVCAADLALPPRAVPGRCSRQSRNTVVMDDVCNWFANRPRLTGVRGLPHPEQESTTR